ncbi:MAG: phosphosulfolactate synthase [Flavobacteriales bacterium]|nr:phosphosulfolactate synthase [Flavobacteriales bacterium]
MMNFDIPGLPERTVKPRDNGLTMMMDKGLSIREVENTLEASHQHFDIAKLGFGTSVITNDLETKLALYKEANIRTCFGGTLFELFYAKGLFDEYRKLIDKYEMPLAEVSDGSIEIPHEVKCNCISKLAEQTTVFSEVGSKDADKIIPPYKWIKLIQTELEAGSWKVIGEAREGGNVGLFRSTGEVRSGLVDEILHSIPGEKIMWEAPQKAQQVWFIKLLGSNANLGNIAPNEIIPVETLRLGLRADTFDMFMNEDAKNKVSSNL